MTDNPDPTTLLEWLNSGHDDERDIQLIALEQICMMLLMSDNVDQIFELFPPRKFIPPLCNIFLDETAPDNILEVTSRALTYFLDISAECTKRMVAAEGFLKALCTKLISSNKDNKIGLDLSEQCIKVLELICIRESGAVYKIGGIYSITLFIKEMGNVIHKDTLNSAMTVLSKLCAKIDAQDVLLPSYLASLIDILIYPEVEIQEKSVKCLITLFERTIKHPVALNNLLSTTPVNKCDHINNTVINVDIDYVKPSLNVIPVLLCQLEKRINALLSQNANNVSSSLINVSSFSLSNPSATSDILPNTNIIENENDGFSVENFGLLQSSATTLINQNVSVRMETDDINNNFSGINTSNTPTVSPLSAQLLKSYTQTTIQLLQILAQLCAINTQVRRNLLLSTTALKTFDAEKTQKEQLLSPSKSYASKSADNNLHWACLLSCLRKCFKLEDRIAGEALRFIRVLITLVYEGPKIAFNIISPPQNITTNGNNSVSRLLLSAANNTNNTVLNSELSSASTLISDFRRNCSALLSRSSQVSNSSSHQILELLFNNRENEYLLELLAGSRHTAVQNIQEQNSNETLIEATGKGTTNDKNSCPANKKDCKANKEDVVGGLAKKKNDDTEKISSFAIKNMKNLLASKSMDNNSEKPSTSKSVKPQTVPFKETPPTSTQEKSDLENAENIREEYTHLPALFMLLWESYEDLTSTTGSLKKLALYITLQFLHYASNVDVKPLLKSLENSIENSDFKCDESQKNQKYSLTQVLTQIWSQPDNAGPRVWLNTCNVFNNILSNEDEYECRDTLLDILDKLLAHNYSGHHNNINGFQNLKTQNSTAVFEGKNILLQLLVKTGVYDKIQHIGTTFFSTKKTLVRPEKCNENEAILPLGKNQMLEQISNDIYASSLKDLKNVTSFSTLLSGPKDAKNLKNPENFLSTTTENNLNSTTQKNDVKNDDNIPKNKEKLESSSYEKFVQKCHEFCSKYPINKLEEDITTTFLKHLNARLECAYKLQTKLHVPTMDDGNNTDWKTNLAQTLTEFRKILMPNSNKDSKDTKNKNGFFPENSSFTCMLTPFELLSSGIIAGLLKILTPQGENGPVDKFVAWQAYERICIFLQIFLPPSSDNPFDRLENFKNGFQNFSKNAITQSPFARLLRKLIEVLEFVENYPIYIHALPTQTPNNVNSINPINNLDNFASSATNIRNGSGILAPAHMHMLLKKLRIVLEKDPTETELLDKTGKVIRVEPLVLLSSLRHFLEQKVIRQWYDYPRSQYKFVRYFNKHSTNSTIQNFPLQEHVVENANKNAIISLMFNFECDSNSFSGKPNGFLQWIGTDAGTTKNHWINPAHYSIIGIRYFVIPDDYGNENKNTSTQTHNNSNSYGVNSTRLEEIFSRAQSCPTSGTHANTSAVVVSNASNNGVGMVPTAPAPTNAYSKALINLMAERMCTIDVDTGSILSASAITFTMWKNLASKIMLNSPLNLFQFYGSAHLHGEWFALECSDRNIKDYGTNEVLIKHVFNEQSQHAKYRYVRIIYKPLNNNNTNTKVSGGSNISCSSSRQSAVATTLYCTVWNAVTNFEIYGSVWDVIPNDNFIPFVTANDNEISQSSPQSSEHQPSSSNKFSVGLSHSKTGKNCVKNENLQTPHDAFTKSIKDTILKSLMGGGGTTNNNARKSNKIEHNNSKNNSLLLNNSKVWMNSKQRNTNDFHVKTQNYEMPQLLPKPKKLGETVCPPVSLPFLSSSESRKGSLLENLTENNAIKKITSNNEMKSNKNKNVLTKTHFIFEQPKPLINENNNLSKEKALKTPSQSSKIQIKLLSNQTSPSISKATEQKKNYSTESFKINNDSTSNIVSIPTDLTSTSKNQEETPVDYKHPSNLNTNLTNTNVNNINNQNVNNQSNLIMTPTMQRKKCVSASNLLDDSGQRLLQACWKTKTQETASNEINQMTTTNPETNYNPNNKNGGLNAKYRKNSLKNFEQQSIMEENATFSSAEFTSTEYLLEDTAVSTDEIPMLIPATESLSYEQLMMCSSSNEPLNFIGNINNNNSDFCNMSSLEKCCQEQQNLDISNEILNTIKTRDITQKNLDFNTKDCNIITSPQGNNEKNNNFTPTTLPSMHSRKKKELKFVLGNSSEKPNINPNKIDDINTKVVVNNMENATILSSTSSMDDRRDEIPLTTNNGSSMGKSHALFHQNWSTAPSTAQSFPNLIMQSGENYHNNENLGIENENCSLLNMNLNISNNYNENNTDKTPVQETFIQLLQMNQLENPYVLPTHPNTIKTSVENSPTCKDLGNTSMSSNIDKSIPITTTGIKRHSQATLHNKNKSERLMFITNTLMGRGQLPQMATSLMSMPTSLINNTLALSNNNNNTLSSTINSVAKDNENNENDSSVFYGSENVLTLTENASFHDNYQQHLENYSSSQYSSLEQQSIPSTSGKLNNQNMPNLNNTKNESWRLNVQRNRKNVGGKKGTFLISTSSSEDDDGGEINEQSQKKEFTLQENYNMKNVGVSQQNFANTDLTSYFSLDTCSNEDISVKNLDKNESTMANIIVDNTRKIDDIAPTISSAQRNSSTSSTDTNHQGLLFVSTLLDLIQTEEDRNTDNDEYFNNETNDLENRTAQNNPNNEDILINFMVEREPSSSVLQEGNNLNQENLIDDGGNENEGENNEGADLDLNLMYFPEERHQNADESPTDDREGGDYPEHEDDDVCDDEGEIDTTNSNTTAEDLDITDENNLPTSSTFMQNLLATVRLTNKDFKQNFTQNNDNSRETNENLALNRHHHPLIQALIDETMIGITCNESANKSHQDNTTSFNELDLLYSEQIPSTSRTINPAFKASDFDIPSEKSSTNKNKLLNNKSSTNPKSEPKEIILNAEELRMFDSLNNHNPNIKKPQSNSMGNSTLLSSDRRKLMAATRVNTSNYQQSGGAINKLIQNYFLSSKAAVCETRTPKTNPNNFNNIPNNNNNFNNTNNPTTMATTQQSQNQLLSSEYVLTRKYSALVPAFDPRPGRYNAPQTNDIDMKDVWSIIHPNLPFDLAPVESSSTTTQSVQTSEITRGDQDEIPTVNFLSSHTIHANSNLNNGKSTILPSDSQHIELTLKAIYGRKILGELPLTPNDTFDKCTIFTIIQEFILHKLYPTFTGETSDYNDDNENCSNKPISLNEKLKRIWDPCMFRLVYKMAPPNNEHDINNKFDEKNNQNSDFVSESLHVKHSNVSSFPQSNYNNINNINNCNHNYNKHLQTVLDLIKVLYYIISDILIITSPFSTKQYALNDNPNNNNFETITNENELQTMMIRELFLSKKLSHKIMHQILNPLALCTVSMPQWCTYLVHEYPMLIPYPVRHDMMYATAFGVTRSLVWLQEHFDATLNPTIERSRQLAIKSRLKHDRVKIPRQCSDTFFLWALRVLLYHQAKKSILEIQFLGEEGTGLGPSLEFYSLVAGELLKKKYGLWLTTNNHHNSYNANINENTEHANNEMADKEASGEYVEWNTGLFPAPYPKASAQTLNYFVFLGCLIAKALQDKRYLDLPFSPAFFKLITNCREINMVTTSQMKTKDITLIRSIRHDMSVLSSLSAHQTFNSKDKEYSITTPQNDELFDNIYIDRNETSNIVMSSDDDLVEQQINMERHHERESDVECSLFDSTYAVYGEEIYAEEQPVGLPQPEENDQERSADYYSSDNFGDDDVTMETSIDRCQRQPPFMIHEEMQEIVRPKSIAPCEDINSLQFYQEDSQHNKKSLIMPSQCIDDTLTEEKAKFGCLHKKIRYIYRQQKRKNRKTCRDMNDINDFYDDGGQYCFDCSYEDQEDENTQNDQFNMIIENKKSLKTTNASIVTKTRKNEFYSDRGGLTRQALFQQGFPINPINFAYMYCHETMEDRSANEQHKEYHHPKGNDKNEYCWDLEGILSPHDLYDIDPLRAKILDCLKRLALQKLAILCDKFMSEAEKCIALSELKLEIPMQENSHTYDPNDDIVNINTHKIALEELCLNFQYNPPSNIYGYAHHDLLPHAEDMIVSLHNLEEYIELMTRFHLNSGISAQMNAFKMGFDKVFPLKTLSAFTPSELKLMLCGEQMPQWNIDDVLKYALPKLGYTKDSPAFLMFARVLTDMNCEERKAFLRFATGTSTLPPGGLANLKPPLTIVKKVLETNPDHDDVDENFEITPNSKANHTFGLIFTPQKYTQDTIDKLYPSVNTCVHYLKLPDYSNCSVMRERLIAALKQTGFHLN